MKQEKANFVDGSFSPCLLVPVFNHGELFSKAVLKLLEFDLPFIVIDDGSVESTRLVLADLAKQHSKMILRRLSVNSGKGKAVQEGIFLAGELGFSHVLQVDADLQHNLEDIPRFLEAAKLNPLSLVNACPVFDETVPVSRLHGRKFTNMWVCIETLSCQILDAMCGFRVYPVKAVVKLLGKQQIASRMGFDIEILVRLVWENVNIINLHSKVVYPLEGSSNFRMLQDNLEITWVHTKLFFGMLLRLPQILFYRLNSLNSSSAKS